MSDKDKSNSDEIAIIGLAGRFPQARNLDEFWQNICAGVETTTFFTDEELISAGVDPSLLKHQNYVKAAALLEDIDVFDADFFHYPPREAETIDPQQRLFLECAWEALEQAGYITETYTGWIGVFGGVGNSGYLYSNLASNPQLLEHISPFQVSLGNDKDYLTSRVSYKLNLKGPSLTVQTACSSSLVAVHLACQSLLSGECDIALAGGATIDIPQQKGYFYQEGGFLSPDGRCRAFDAQAQGFFNGSGVGIVALKLLDDALADGDTIHAIIKGSAVNNDGSFKAGFTAPSVERQKEVILSALATANVDANTITYIETHGTATPLGDPIEISALRQAFRNVHTHHTCAIGSIKTNIGHLGPASGIAGLIKTVLALKHGLLPASLHFEHPNPAIDFAHSPFYVNTQLSPWDVDDVPRRAGVSSFGIGGTNAHIILEEAPPVEHQEALRDWHLLVLSARTPSALEHATDNLIAHLRSHSDSPLADVVYTYQIGRRPFQYRRTLVFHVDEDLISLLEKRDPRRLLTGRNGTEKPSLLFMFPDVDNHFMHMARNLYESEEGFREAVKRCSILLQPLSGIDLCDILASEQSRDAFAHLFHQPSFNQPFVFVIEYALAQLWISWGISPHAMAGYSLGEFVAACLAGVFSLEDALTLVVKRANLLQALPEGSMLAVSPPLVEPLIAFMQTIKLHAPQVPFLSNRTGTWMTKEQATDPEYWATHLCWPVQFAQSMNELFKESECILLEIGPDQTLCNLVKQHASGEEDSHLIVLPSFYNGYAFPSQQAGLLQTLGKLWLTGLHVDWVAYAANEQRQRIPLPTYPFERKRYWIEPGNRVAWMNGYQSVEKETDAQSNEKYGIQEEPQPSGRKVNGQRIVSESEQGRSEIDNAFVLSHTSIEEVLTRIWSEVLGIDAIDRDDNFFELGGDSILGIQIATRLNKEHVHLTVKQVLQHQTIAELVKQVSSQVRQEPIKEESLLVPEVIAQSNLGGDASAIEQREDSYPLSPMQRGMLFHTLYDEKSRIYFDQLSYLIHNHLHLGAFFRAWQLVLEQHSALRTAFYWEGLDHPFQVVYKRVSMPIVVYDWSHLSSVEQEEQLQTFLREDRERAFDLSKAPLLRITLLKRGLETYQLIWSHHHILVDGWSLALIFENFLRYYSLLRQNLPVHLHKSQPYSNYISWLYKQDPSRARVFWHTYFVGFNAPVPLHIDQASQRFLAPSSVFEEYIERFHMDLTVSLQVFCKTHQISLNTLFQGAWALLMSRYSGEQDVIFGTTVSGRSLDLPGIETMVGLFINTLPTRVHVAPTASLASWLKELQSLNIEMREYESSALTDIQNWGEVRNAPLFEYVLVFENYPVGNDVRSRTHEFHIESAFAIERTNFPLTIMIAPGATVTIRVIYDSQRFTSTSIESMIKYVKDLLMIMLAHPQQKLVSLFRQESIEQQSLMAWNATYTTYPDTVCFHHLFEAQVAQTPDAVAVVCDDAQLTYHEVNRRANQLAHYLQERGIGPESRVGVCLDRSTFLVVGLLAILKAGGAYVPLDPEHPLERLIFSLTDAQVIVVLANQCLSVVFASLPMPVICLENDWECIVQYPSVNPERKVRPKNLAYMIYTSGSTGKPKGVQIEHRSLVNFLCSMQKQPGITRQDRILAVTTISFDIAALEVFLPLMTGAQVIILNKEATTDGILLARMMERTGTTVMQATPATWRLLLEAGWRGKKDVRFLCGGEALTLDLARQLLECGTSLWNMYGPTETTIWSTLYMVEKEATHPYIGRPIANTTVYVLDTQLQSVPIGVIGELYIGGYGVARGYFNRPELTAERFVPDPWGKEPGARLYKTGDAVRYTSDGVLEFIGRMDYQVKIRGYRIEPGEIEAALTQHDAVSQAVVCVREPSHGDKRLVTYVVPEPTRNLTLSQMRLYLQTKLPAYMIPTDLILLDRFPLTTRGKIDRAALLDTAPLVAASPRELAPPRTSIEKTLYAILTRILAIDDISIYDNFFDLGAHSLHVTQIVGQIKEIFPLELPLRYLFEAPTIADFAQLLEMKLLMPEQRDHWMVEASLPREQSEMKVLSSKNQSSAPASSSGKDEILPVKTEEFLIEFDDFLTRAQLTYPEAGDGPFPTVLLIHGSGPMDMDFTMTDIYQGRVLSQIFYDLAMALPLYGFAVVRYNQHYIEGPDDFHGKQRYLKWVSLQKLQEDVETVYKYIKNILHVDANKIILYGLSEGSTIATQVVVAYPEIAGLILQSPVSNTWREVIVHQYLKLGISYLRTQGDVNGEIRLDAIEKMLQAEYGPVIKNVLASIFVEAFTASGSKKRLALKEHLKRSISLDEEIVPSFNRLLAEFDRSEGKLSLYAATRQLAPVREVILQYRGPVLLLQGEQDAYVPASGAYELQDALSRSSHSDHALFFYPRFGHSLGLAQNPYKDIFAPMEEQVLHDVVAWLKQHYKSE